MDPALTAATLGCAVTAAVCWLLGVATGEHSWVDRLWSLAPIAYVAWFFREAAGFDARLALMTALVGAWGARLTYNFARKGGYAKGGEDYRWQVLRQRMRPWQFQLFALGFVAGLQNAILLALTLPAWVALRGRATPLGALDAIAAIAFVAFLVGETVADEQQWRFQQDKKQKLARGEPADPPFLTTGLFRYSRHPNFFCEMGLWWAFYLFSVAATGRLLNESVIGAVALTALFQGSTSFTEAISLSKYPAYAGYQRATSRLFPWIAAPSPPTENS